MKVLSTFCGALLPIFVQAQSTDCDISSLLDGHGNWGTHRVRLPLGLNGADLNSIQSHKRIVRTVDYGFAGDVDFCNGEVLSKLILLGIAPIFCAITHDRKGQLLNTNADTIASSLAVALSNFFEVELVFTFEKAGVLYDADNEHSLIPTITKSDYQQLKSDKIIFDGMIPKRDNAFDALERGVQLVKIGQTKFVLLD